MRLVASWTHALAEALLPPAARACTAGQGIRPAKGGAAGGCAHPKSAGGIEPLAANVYIVRVDPNPGTTNDLGSFQSYPSDEAAPTAAGGAILNFTGNTTLGNSTNVTLCTPADCPTAGEFGIKVNSNDSHIIVGVFGYFYPAESNLITVSAEGGDFTDPQDALNSIPTTGGDAPSATNRYLVKLGPGTFDLGAGLLDMRSHVSVIGSGVEATTLRSSSGGGVVRFRSVTGTELAAMTVYNTGGGGTVANATGVLVDTDSGNVSDPRLYDLKIIAEAGTTETKAILVQPGPGLGPTAPVIERVDAVAQNPASGAANAINIQQCGNMRLERVNVFGVDRGLVLGAAANCTNRILWSQFSAPSDADIFANPAANAVIGHSHLVNGTITSGGGAGTVSCLSVTTPTDILNTDCSDPTP